VKDQEFQIISRKNLLFFFCSFCLCVGYYAGNRALVCLGFGLAALIFLAAGNAINALRDVSITRSHYPRAFEDDNLRVTLTIKSGSLHPLYVPEITDTFPAGDHYWIPIVIPRAVFQNAETIIEYSEECSRRRGIYFLGPVKVSCSDPLGVFKSRREIQDLSRLLVYPKAQDLEYFEVLGDGTLTRIGIETLLRSGHCEEFIGLREYREGDNPRRIHWPSSVRHDRFLVKEFLENITTEVTLILDMHRLALSGIGDVTSVEYIIQAAADITGIAIEKNHLVQMFALSANLAHVPPGGGRDHLLTILDSLTYLRPQGEGAFEDDLEKVIPLLKRGSTAILITGSANVHADRLNPLIRVMIGRHIRVIMVIIDDTSFHKVYRDQEAQRRRALPIEELKGSLYREGCALYLAGKGDDLAVRLQTPAI